jgi:uncharacterized protein (DUF4415 family)
MQMGIDITTKWSYKIIMKSVSEKKVTRPSLTVVRDATSKTDWPRLQSMSEKDITQAAAGDPDALPLDDPFFEAARNLPLSALLKEGKRQITLRLDAEILDWFRASGVGYQSRMNAVLKAYVQIHRGTRS